MMSAPFIQLTQHALSGRQRNLSIGGAQSTWKKRGDSSGRLVSITPSQNNLGIITSIQLTDIAKLKLT